MHGKSELNLNGAKDLLGAEDLQSEEDAEQTDKLMGV